MKLINEVILCEGRLSFSCLKINAKFPILLPSKCYLRNLIIHDVHRYCLHSGVNHVLSVIRNRFWIPQGRQRIKTIIRKCVICKRQNAKTLHMHNTAPLPEFRVVRSNPFAITGVDYTGASNIKAGTANNKVYICLFTCMTNRAIHLELVESGDVQAFMRAFRRFVARRSCPSIMISDNASVFCSSAVNLKKICESEHVCNSLSQLNLQWKFIPSRAPHFGGIWERLIGMTKEILHKCLGRSSVNYIELNTLIYEIECNLNNRPLTYLIDDINIDPISPSHLIYGRQLDSLNNEEVDFSELTDPSYGDVSLI